MELSSEKNALLALARAQKIDLAALPLVTLLDQLTAALQQAPTSVPLGQKGDWVVMAAWLVQLRARLLLPADPAAQQDAAAEAGQFRDRLLALQEAQALAAWLECRPQLGHEVFCRSHPPSRAHWCTFGLAGTKPCSGVSICQPEHLP
jgi:segregation and condensation protein A